MESEINKTMESILDTYKLALLYGDAACVDTNRYLKMAEDLIVLKENEKRLNAVLDIAKEETTVESFERTYKSEMEKLNAKKINAKNTTEYKRFKEELSKIKSVSEDNIDNEDILLEAEVNVYDPICRKRMVDPVRNVQCGHHYEKSTILQTIKVNTRYRCPVAGCGNRDPIIKEHLVDDVEFKNKLLESAEMASKSQNSL